MEKRTQRIAFPRGLNREYDNDLEAQAAFRLLNWQPQPDGALRVRRRWLTASDSGVPAAAAVRGIGFLPVHEGYMTPIRRQRRKRARSGTAIADITGLWYRDTVENSYLLAILSWVNYNADNTHTPTSSITVTPPTGWSAVSGALVHNTSTTPASISMQAFHITSAAIRDGDREEVFTFVGGTVRRAVLETMEWRGVAGASPLDKVATSSGRSVYPRTGETVETTQSKELAIAALAGRTKDRSIKPSNFTRDWYEFRDVFDPPHWSTGREDEWHNMVVARNVLTETTTAHLEAYYDETVQEDDASSRWVGFVITLKAKERNANDRDFIVIDHAGTSVLHTLYALDPDNIDVGTWDNIGTLASTNTSTKPLSFAAGMGMLLISARDFIRPTHGRRGLYQWDGVTLVRINRSPAGQTLAYWGNRFWAGGEKEKPARLWFSDEGDGTMWDEEINWIEVGNESERILDIKPVLDGLMIAKRRSLWLLTGAGPGSYSLQRLSGGTGSKGRCILPVPGGALIAGIHHIWHFEGGPVNLISRPLDAWWSKVTDWSTRYCSGAYVNGLCYFTWADEDSMVVYDLDQKIWWVDKAVDKRSVVFSHNNHLLLSGQHTGTAGALDYQQHPEGERRRDGTGQEVFEVMTQEMMIGTPAQPVTPRWLYIAYQKKQYQTAHNNVVVTPYYDGQAQTPRTITELHPHTNRVISNGDERIRLDVGVKNRNACHKVQFKIAFTATAGNSTVFDIEAIEFVYDVEELR